MDLTPYIIIGVVGGVILVFLVLLIIQSVRDDKKRDTEREAYGKRMADESQRQLAKIQDAIGDIGSVFEFEGVRMRLIGTPSYYSSMKILARYVTECGGVQEVELSIDDLKYCKKVEGEAL